MFDARSPLRQHAHLVGRQGAVVDAHVIDRGVDREVIGEARDEDDLHDWTSR